MKLLIGALVSFLIGAGCRYFDIPVPSPPVLPGALLVVAMTLGYSVTDRALIRKARISTTRDLCGGPTGSTAAAATSNQTRGYKRRDYLSAKV
jgi:XapX domain-containing protein